MAKFNVKTIDKKTIQAEGKLVKTSNPPKAPIWFTSWTQEFEQKIDQRFDEMDQRLDNLVKLNNLKE